MFQEQIIAETVKNNFHVNSQRENTVMIHKLAFKRYILSPKPSAQNDLFRCTRNTVLVVLIFFVLNPQEEEIF